MYEYLMSILTCDELDLLRAKLAAGSLASDLVAAKVNIFVDAMHDDYPYSERIADEKANNVLTAEWWLAVKYGDALYKIGSVAEAHTQTARELRSLMSW